MACSLVSITEVSRPILAITGNNGGPCSAALPVKGNDLLSKSEFKFFLSRQLLLFKLGSSHDVGPTLKAEPVPQLSECVSWQFTDSWQVFLVLSSSTLSCLWPVPGFLLHSDPGPGRLDEGVAGLGCADEGLARGPAGGVRASLLRLAGEDMAGSVKSPDRDSGSSSLSPLPSYFLTMFMTLYPSPLLVLYPCSPLKI